MKILSWFRDLLLAAIAIFGTMAAVGLAIDLLNFLRTLHGMF